MRSAVSLLRRSGLSVLGLAAFYACGGGSAADSDSGSGGRATSSGGRTTSSMGGGRSSGGAHSTGGDEGKDGGASGGGRASGGRTAGGNVSSSGGGEATGGLGGAGGEGGDGQGPLDECNQGAANCSENAVCTDTLESYSCRCKAGYSGNGFICDDVDECKLGLDDCDVVAHCSNSPGTFGCACLLPYFGDGRSCSCRRKSRSNLLEKSGFDDLTSLSTGTRIGAWDPQSNAVWTGGSDADGCPESGALRMSSYQTDGSYAWATQCVSVQANTEYQWGFRYKRTAGGRFGCQAYFFGDGCSGFVAYGNGFVTEAPIEDDSTWTSLESPVVELVPEGATTVLMYCHTEVLPTNGEIAEASVDVDQIYFTPKDCGSADCGF